jgi:hypothetical protein
MLYSKRYRYKYNNQVDIFLLMELASRKISVDKNDAKKSEQFSAFRNL